MGGVGVDLFIVISVWFLCDKGAKFNLWKLVSIVLMTSFYYTIWYLLSCTVFNVNIFSVVGLCKALLAPFLGSYWFTTIYILFYLICPLLNKLVNSLSDTQLKYSLYILTISVPGFMMVTGGNAGYGMVGVFSYIFLLIAYLKRNQDNIFRKYSGIIAVTDFLLIVAVLCFANKYGIVRLTRFMNEKYSIFVIILVVSVFYCFEKRKDYTSKWINTIAASTFGIYLIHSGFIGEKLLATNIAGNNRAFMSATFAVEVIVYAIVVFVVGAVVDIIRKNTVERVALGVLQRIRPFSNIINLFNSNWGMRGE